MKKISIFCVILLSISFQVISQTSVERIFIKGGSRAWDNFMKEIYLYTSFETGIVEYKNGKQFKGELNYNKVLGAIQFIDEQGDTLSLGNEENIRSIVIGNNEFFYAPDCMQEIMEEGNVKLVKNERVRIADKQKIGGYGISNSTGTIESIDRMDTRGLAFNPIDINETLLLRKTTNFYLETDKNVLVPASRKNILSMFSKHESAIRDYIRLKQIDFSQEDDLKELTGYLSKL